MDSDSDSSLSEAPPEKELQKLAPIFIQARKATKKAAPPPVVSPPRPKRAPSPPHEEVLADNSDIAFIVMFRSRFQEAFPGKTPHFGPQDVERGVVDNIPSPEIQGLLCALLALVLNRKKPVERGHHGRALEEAVASHKSQWPLKWNGQNPLHGGKDFNNMTPAERLNLLRTLIIWSLSSSEVVSGIIKDKYKQQRHNDDENQPLSVQPWGQDGDKRRYFLIQGLDDHSFRVYREGSRHTRNAHWYSMAGTIDEVKALATKLENKEYDGSQAARRLAGRMHNAIPMFEATEEKRHRREYRQQRRAAFTRPEPGFGIYEGRTRGKRMRYTYDDDEGAAGGDDSDATSTRRSTRHQSARNTPFEVGPQYTASGRQIRQPRTGEYGESLLSKEVMSDELGLGHDGSERAGSNESDHVQGGRPMRAAKGYAYVVDNPRKRKHIDGYNDIDAMSDEEDDDATGDDWNSDANASGEDNMPDADDVDDEPSEDDDDDDLERPSGNLIVKLKVPKLGNLAPKQQLQDTPPTSPPTPGQVKLEENSMLAEDATDGAARVQPTDSVPNGSVHSSTDALDPIANDNSTFRTAEQAEHRVLAAATQAAPVQYPTPSVSREYGNHSGTGMDGHTQAPATTAVGSAPGSGTY